MIILAAVIGYLTLAAAFYTLIAKSAPIKDDEFAGQAALYVIEGGIAKESRKAA